MIEMRRTVHSENGIHNGPAVGIMRAIDETDVTVNGVRPKCALDLRAMGIEYGDTIVFRTEGDEMPKPVKHLLL